MTTRSESWADRAYRVLERVRRQHAARIEAIETECSRVWAAAYAARREREQQPRSGIER